MNRRTFLESAGSAALVAGVSRAAKSANDAVNVAVIGVWGRGLQHLDSYSKLPNVNIAMVCDIDERLLPKAQSLAEKTTGKRPKMETDLRRVLEN
jgi:hypothetical protein